MLLIKLLVFLYCLGYLVLIIINPSLINEIVIETLNVWLYKVFPPIFLFYIISTLLICSRLTFLIAKILKPLNKLLKLNSFELYLTSILIGNPSSAILISTNQLEKKEATILYSFASFITPFFIFQNIPVFGIKIYISHLLSSIIIISIINYKTKYQNAQINIDRDFFKYMKNISYILLSIATFMIFFNSIIYLLKLLNISNHFLCLLEIGNGINLTNNLYLLTFLVSFNGLSLILQNYSYSYKCICFKRLFISKVIHGLLSVLIVLLFSIF